MNELSAGPGEMMGNAGPGMLAGLRVIEIADERAEYAGLLLAGLGCDVIKIEPPEGNATRHIGPFLNDEPGTERSLFFWNYNRGKKSVVLDIAAQPEALLRLLDGTDILLDSSCGALNTALGLDRAELNARFPKLITARMTPFGDDGPWADFKASDLIHLALGGVMMNCGYDADPNLHYDLPPIAPQVWHAYHIAGEQLATGIIAALIARNRNGQGQDVSVAVHEAVSKNPELDIMHWVMRRVPLWRLTCRHALEVPNHSPSIMHTKDGRWYISHGMGARDQSAGAAAFEIRHAGRSATAATRCRSDGACRARLDRKRRDPRAHDRRGATFYPSLDLQRHAVAGGAGGRLAVGAAPQAA